ncbi:MAG: tripartite tricarboxylate transporter permease [Hyphomicrobiaceae bacterium]
MDAILKALSIIASADVLAVVVGASMLGILIGCVPGLTAVMGVALLVPFTFFMEPVPAIAAIVALAATAIFAGDIPAALVRIPGTPASAAYADECYKLTQRGEPWRGLGVCLAASVLGGLFGTLMLVLAAPQLARFATQFSSPEYFWLGVLGLTCAAFLASGAPLKGLVALSLGLFFSTIGIDVGTGQPRFTFGSMELMGGIDLIPLLVGFFAVPELIRQVTKPAAAPADVPRYTSIFKDLLRDLWTYRVQILRGNVSGTLIGALPGAGADIAAWVSYATSRRLSKEPEKFGTGHLEGVAEASAANNSSLSGAWVPTLVFGIPGDSITAIVIGVLYLKGMEPGPAIFVKTPELVYAVFIVFFLANILLLPLGWLVIRASRYILDVPRNVLVPVILMACIVGAYAIQNSLFDVGVMLFMGVLGYIMEENDIPVAPAILALVLGKVIEFNLVTTLIKSDGNWLWLVNRPIAAGLALVTVAIWAVTLTALARPNRRSESEGTP